MKDLSDVLELIKILNLPADFTDHLNPFVKGKYLELWNQGKKRYETLWRNKWLTSKAKTIDEMIESLRAAADHLDEMRKAGVTLEDDGGVGDDYATLVTTDPNVANKFGMDEEREYLDEQRRGRPARSVISPRRADVGRTDTRRGRPLPAMHSLFRDPPPAYPNRSGAQ